MTREDVKQGVAKIFRERPELDEIQKFIDGANEGASPSEPEAIEKKAESKKEPAKPTHAVPKGRQKAVEKQLQEKGEGEKRKLKRETRTPVTFHMDKDLRQRALEFIDIPFSGAKDLTDFLHQAVEAYLETKGKDLTLLAENQDRLIQMLKKGR